MASGFARYNTNGAGSALGPQLTPKRTCVTIVRFERNPELVKDLMMKDKEPIDERNVVTVARSSNPWLLQGSISRNFWCAAKSHQGKNAPSNRTRRASSRKATTR